MNIPKKIKIGALTFKIKYEKNLTGGSNNLGEMRPMPQEIAIEVNLAPDIKERTFLHEVIEAIDYNYNLSLEHYKIEILGAALQSFIKDNPKVFSDEKKDKKRR